MDDYLVNSANSQITLPKAKSTLKINEDLKISFIEKMPNWWFRLWLRLFLGWKWEKLGNNQK